MADVQKPVLPPPNRVFGGILRFLRQQSGMNLFMLASSTSLDGDQLSRIENGSEPPPSDKIIEKILAALAPEDQHQVLGALRRAKTSYNQGLSAKQIESEIRELEKLLGTTSIEFIPEAQLIRTGTVCTGMSSNQQWLTGPIKMFIQEPETGTLTEVECILRPPLELPQELLSF